MEKKLLLPLFAVFVLLAGCAKSDVPKSNAETQADPQFSNEEARLKDDLFKSAAFSEFAQGLNMEITSLEIIKRQTVEESRIDTVWVKVSAASDAVQGEMYYVMTYGLYNDGWLLDDIADDATEQWLFTPLKGVSEEEIHETLRYFPEDLEILSNELDLASGTQTVTISYSEHHTYCDAVYKEQLIYYFGSTYGVYGTSGAGYWGESFVTLDTDMTWNVCGTYRTPDGDTLSIDQFDTDGIFVFTAYSGKTDEPSSKHRFTYRRLPDGEVRSGRMLAIQDISAKECLGSLEANSKISEYCIYYGYSLVCEDFDWYDISFITESNFLIGPDHIYYRLDAYQVDGTRTVYVSADELTRID